MPNSITKVDHITYTMLQEEVDSSTCTGLFSMLEGDKLDATPAASVEEQALVGASVI